MPDVVGPQGVAGQSHLDTVFARIVKRDLEGLFDRLARLEPFDGHLQREPFPVDTDGQVDPTDKSFSVIGHRRGQLHRHARTGHLQLAFEFNHSEIGVAVGNRPNQVDRHTVRIQLLDLLDQPRAVLPVVLPEVRDDVQVFDAGGLFGEQLGSSVEPLGEVRSAERTRQGLQPRGQFPLESAVDALFEIVRLRNTRQPQYRQPLGPAFGQAGRHQPVNNRLTLVESVGLVPLILHRRGVVQQHDMVHIGSLQQG